MTINGLKNTIRYDEDVFRWAITFLEGESVRKTLPDNKIWVFKILHFLIMAINFTAAGFVFKVLTSSPRPVDFALILALAIGVYLLELPYKNFTASLVTDFIKANFSTQELENRTLLQLGVQLERKFGAGAMVDTLWGWTKAFRAVFFIAFIVVTRFTLFLCGAWVLRAASRSTTMTSFLKAAS